MKIAFITGDLSLGGASTFLCNLGGELVRRGIGASVWNLGSTHPMAEDFSRLQVPVFCSNPRMIVEDRMTRVLSELAEYQPTAVIANLSAISFEVFRYLPQGVRRVGMVHADDPLVYRTIAHYAPWLDHLIAVSSKISEHLKSMPAFVQVSVTYLPCGVPMPLTNPRLLRTFHEPLRILYLGRLDEEQKRVRLFPPILERLKTRHLQFHWTLAGEGPERPYLEQAMQSTEGAQIHFLGKIPYSEVSECLSEQDIFLLTSDYEGLPLSMLEAMGHGVVPVVSDLPSGIREVLDSSCGIVVDPSNVGGYVEGILQLDRDRARLESMSLRAHERVRDHFSHEAMADRWIQFLSQREGSHVNWPNTWSIQPLLDGRRRWKYAAPFRPIRRWLKRLNAQS